MRSVNSTPLPSGSEQLAEEVLPRDEVLADVRASSSATEIVGDNRGAAATKARRQADDTEEVLPRDEVLADVRASSSATEIVGDNRGAAATKARRQADDTEEAPDRDDGLTEAQPTKADAVGSTSMSKKKRAKIRQDAEATAIRNQCREAAKLLCSPDGIDYALTRALEVVTAHPRSTVALNLAGDLHSNISAEIREQEYKSKSPDPHLLREALKHSMTALAYFTEARRLAARCIVTPVSRGNELMCIGSFENVEQQVLVLPKMMLPFPSDVESAVLLHTRGISDLFADVQSEFVRGSTMIDPDDPAKHHVSYDLRRRTKHGNSRRTKHALKKLDAREDEYELVHSSPKDNISKARSEAAQNLNKLMAFVCDQLIPHKVETILKQDVAGDHAGAREEAKRLAATYSYCARARILAVYLDLQYTSSLDRPQVVPILRELIEIVHQAAADFRRSIVVLKLLAELYSAIDQKNYALTICRRALLIHNPDDPQEQDVPVGSVEGDCREDRISTIRDEIRQMCDSIAASVRARHTADLLPSQDEELAVDNKSPVKGKGKKRNNKANNESTKVHHAFKYSHKKLQKSSRLAEWEEWLQKANTPPPPEPARQLHMVQQKLVPDWEVNLYAKFCQAVIQCSNKKFICHVCCFEELNCTSVKKSEGNHHYLTVHTLSSKETLTCPEQACGARVRSYEDFRRHYYFVHRLHTGWWRIT